MLRFRTGPELVSQMLRYFYTNRHGFFCRQGSLCLGFSGRQCISKKMCNLSGILRQDRGRTLQSNSPKSLPPMSLFGTNADRHSPTLSSVIQRNCPSLSGVARLLDQRFCYQSQPRLVRRCGSRCLSGMLHSFSIGLMIRGFIPSDMIASFYFWKAPARIFKLTREREGAAHLPFLKVA